MAATFNKEAIQVIIKMAVANDFGKLLIGKGGVLSTPAASCLIRKYSTDGGIILSASHNPGGPDEDFGVKFNGSNGAPAPESLTQSIAEFSREIGEYRIAETADLDLDNTSSLQKGNTQIEIIDSIADYAELMASLFDFDSIKSLFSAGTFKMCFDAMHAVTGGYATIIIEEQLGAHNGTVINSTPLTDFGGGHPDPNLIHAHELVKKMESGNGNMFGAASDGDGDRNMVLGEGFYINPCDSLAVIVANARLLPAFSGGLVGVARSMPTSRAVDRVAKELGIDCYETPTGWKFFGNLLDDDRIQICGEESFGTGANHVREKDGLWAVLCWLNIIAQREASPQQILQAHWEKYGRDYFTRHDFEAIDADQAQLMFTDLQARLSNLRGHEYYGNKITDADNFSYVDPVDHNTSTNQGIRVHFENGARIVLRLSGTGTQGATLRLYYDVYEKPDGNLDLNPQDALKTLILSADEIVGITKYTNRSEPDVIT